MITASLVLYNTNEEDIIRVIDSYSPSETRLLYIIDNSESESLFCKEISNDFIAYIFNGKNLGYGSANNIGIKKSIELKARYHIILNPDIQFESTVIDELIEFADHNTDVVYIMPKVVNQNGELQYLCKLLPTPFDLFFRRFFPEIGIFKRINDHYTLKNTRYDHIMNPPCLSGCFMFLRTSTLEEHELLFDERFFMYFEDFDLIRQIHKVGKTIFYPNVLIIHKHEMGSYKKLSLLYLHVISACKYFNKYGWLFDKERKELNLEIIRDENVTF